VKESDDLFVAGLSVSVGSHMKNAALGYQPTSATASTSTTSESPLVSNTNVSNHSDTTTPRTTSITPRAPKRIVAPNSNSSNNTTRHAFTLSKYQRRHTCGINPQFDIEEN
ncbi:hypothetical protein INT48_004791, partial [Thamnidium elegans]